MESFNAKDLSTIGGIATISLLHSFIPTHCFLSPLSDRPRNGEDKVYKLASILLIVTGGSYILLFLSGKGGKSHSYNQPLEKMVVVGLVLVPALSPCATTLPVFLAVGNSLSMMVLAIIVLLFRYRMKNDSEF
ncbi:hypothetical protein Gogos_015311 [Gossypium gossypioides]|uniref:Uncharacterized protein n=1 Tax=Gossypium gossypioides TaxID=34282 RepID=A0A7J9C1G7_GOSGO|nr:hypothetical protein [Gossypium gossypioides]